MGGVTLCALVITGENLIKVWGYRMMPYCSNCGAQIDQSEYFCSNCGRQTPRRRPRKIPNFILKGNKWLTMVLLLMIAFLIVSIVKNSSHFASAEYNHNNHVNGSCVAEQRGWVYYISDTNQSIYKMKPDGSKRERLTNRSCSNLNVVDQWIYFINTLDNGIYRVKNDGSELETISDKVSSEMIIYENEIYFINGRYEWDSEAGNFKKFGSNLVCKMDLDGGNMAALNSVASHNMNIVNDVIYYYDDVNGTISRIATDGNNASVICHDPDEVMLNFQVYREKIYYSDFEYDDDLNSGIYTLDMVNGNKNKIISTICYSFNFCGDNILYMKDSNSSAVALWKADLDGNDGLELYGGSAYDLIVLGDWVYFWCFEGLTRINLKTLEYEQVNSKSYWDLKVTDNFLFFINKDDGDCLYRVNLDGSNVTKLTQTDCSAIYIHEEWLYYVGYSNDDSYYGLFKMDLEANECYLVGPSVRHSPLFFHNRIYYRDIWDGVLYCIGTGGEEYGAIIESPSLDLQVVHEDWIYFAGSGIMRMRTNGSEQTYLCYDNCLHVIVHDGWLYYINNSDGGNIYKAETDGTNQQAINFDSSSYIAAYKDWIYYVNSDDGLIYKIALDGTHRTQLNNAASSYLYIFDDKIYYTNEYDKGSIYKMNLDGTDNSRLFAKNSVVTERSDYFTFGVDDAPEKVVPTIDYEATQVMIFEDGEFEKFLCVMFDKKPGTILGSDLLSVRFLGYYEGNPIKNPDLKLYDSLTGLDNNMVNCSFKTAPDTIEHSSKYEAKLSSTFPGLDNNIVYFSFETVPDTIENISEIMFGDVQGDALAYGQRCNKMYVYNNEWMSEHVLNHLYYFKNLEALITGYCWLPDDFYLPGSEVRRYDVNTHSKTFHLYN